jgi:hypothetical protein
MSGINIFSNNSVKLAMMKRNSQLSFEEMPMVSFRKASDDIMEQGISTLVSLKSDGPLPEEVECMAAEFKDAIRGEISSVIAPMTLKLKGNEDTSKVKIGSIKKLASLISGENFPFYRVDRLKILYIPLFSSDDNDDQKITFSIQDSSMKVGSKNKTVSKATVPLNKMSMVELSASYFVPKKNLEMIEFGYKASKVPVQGRAFAAVFAAFYIHKDFIPAIMKTREPIVLLVDDVDVPADINKTSSIKGLCDKINNQVEKKKGKFLKEKMKQEMVETSRRETMLFVNNDRDSGISVSAPSYEEITTGEIGKIYKAQLKEYLPRNLPIYDVKSPILDTGAPDHWIHNPNIGDLVDSNKSMEIKEGMTFHRVTGVEMKLGVHWVRLKEALYSRKHDFPLISYKKLVNAGIVDCLKSIGNDKAILSLGGRVIFELDCKGPYFVFVPSDSTSSVMILE